MFYRFLQITQHNVSVSFFVQEFGEVCLPTLPNEGLFHQQIVFLIVDSLNFNNVSIIHLSLL